jgi:hypothetical protein
VPEDEVDVVFLTEVGQPVPAKHAFDADDESLSIGPDQLQERVRPSRNVLMDKEFTVVSDNADVKSLCMEVDATVEWVLLLIESHHGLLG